MEEIMEKLLKRMDEQFEKQTVTLTKNITESVTQTLTATMDDKLRPLIEENHQLKKEVNILKSKINKLEKDSRRNNVILHGIKETEKSFPELLTTIIQTFDKIGGKEYEEWDKWEICSARRIGRKQEGKTRPILITLSLEWRKIQLLKNKKLYPKDIYITEDFPKEVVEARKDLIIQQKQEINNGKIAYIRYDKLIVKDKPVEKRKRSPQPLLTRKHNMIKKTQTQVKLTPVKSIKQMHLNT
ncbi:hypothetical protein NE865_04899 [Phthorimaea operculella]|nr:hypothetical protein NE865_04899 [Phthorimaea operculella]